MITRSMVPEYLKYILPTMLTFTLAGIYSIVDGIFVGHAVGDAGLAGINVAYPLVCLILSVGTGLGMGGGVISSIARGKGDDERARRVVGVTLFMLAAASIPILVIYTFAAEPLCAVLGGQGETLEQAVRYLKVIAIGAPFQVLVTGCTPLIRNRGQVAYAMAVQLLAGVVNVVLDYVFVMLWGRGTAGAAEATVVAQSVAFCSCWRFSCAKPIACRCATCCPMALSPRISSSLALRRSVLRFCPRFPRWSTTCRCRTTAGKWRLRRMPPLPTWRISCRS